MTFSTKKLRLSLIILAIIALVAVVARMLYKQTTQTEEKTVAVEMPKKSIKKPPVVRTVRAYTEKSHPTPNFEPNRRNTVEGVILHHTAEPTVERSLAVLTSTTKRVGTHVVIDLDGTRYIMAKPNVVTFHAGRSVLHGKEGCNDFTIGIEFQGNTLETPLTEDQIHSAIEYLKPIMLKYKIPLANVVTHEMVRNAYMRKYPKKRCSGKVDITQKEYIRFMNELKKDLPQI